MIKLTLLRKKWMLVIISIFFLTISSVNITNAYNLFGIYQSSTYVTYDQSALSSGWKGAVWEGARQWNDVIPSPFRFFPTNDSSNTNDVRVTFIDGPYGAVADMTPYDSSGGVLDPWTSASIVRFRIRFDNSETWTEDTSAPGSNELDSPGFAAHEFGHSAGIAHTQRWNCAWWVGVDDRPTMCAILTDGTATYRYLEQDDRDALNAKYP